MQGDGKTRPPGASSRDWFRAALLELESGKMARDARSWVELVRGALPRLGVLDAEDVAQDLLTHLWALCAKRSPTWSGLLRCEEPRLRARLKAVARRLHQAKEVRAAERHALGQLVRKIVAGPLAEVDGAPVTIRAGHRFSSRLVGQAVAWTVQHEHTPRRAPAVLTALMRRYRDDLSEPLVPVDADEEVRARRVVDGCELAARLVIELTGEERTALCVWGRTSSLREVAAAIGCRTTKAHALVRRAVDQLARIARPPVRVGGGERRTSRGTMLVALREFCRLIERHGARIELAISGRSGGRLP